jgi:hypothetical protein
MPAAGVELYQEASESWQQAHVILDFYSSSVR